MKKENVLVDTTTSEDKTSKESLKIQEEETLDIRIKRVIKCIKLFDDFEIIKNDSESKKPNPINKKERVLKQIKNLSMVAVIIMKIIKFIFTKE